MKTVSTLIFLISGFWLTLFISNFDLGKENPFIKNFQHVAGDASNRPLSLDSNCEPRFIFKTLPTEHDEIQIVLGVGSFGLEKGSLYQGKFQSLEIPNIHLRTI